MKKDEQHFYEFEDFRLDAVRGVLFRDGSVVDITPKAVQILRLLVERKGEPVSKEEIFAEVWPDSFVEEANLSHHIFKLRKALGADGELKLIETLPKRGYRFVGKLHTSSGHAPEPFDKASKWKWSVPAVIAVVAIVAALSWFLFPRTETEVAPGVTASEKPSLAVLP